MELLVTAIQHHGEHPHMRERRLLRPEANALLLPATNFCQIRQIRPAVGEARWLTPRLGAKHATEPHLLLEM